jgi:predicted metalloprotease with PDZ domain
MTLNGIDYLCLVSQYGRAVRAPGIFFLIIFLSASAQAQNSNIEISILSLSPTPRVKITGQIKQGRSNWSFEKNYAGVRGLAERIGNLTFTDDNGNKINFAQFVAGEYQTKTAATKFSYEIKLEPPQDTSDSAFVSWLTAERGLLLPGDLLPLSFGDDKTLLPLSVKFVLPENWRAISVEKEKGENNFEVTDVPRSVFAVGVDLRKKTQKLSEMDFSFVTAGEWAFTDEAVMLKAIEILTEHKKTWGGSPSAHSMLLLLPFPRPLGITRWSAETRGQTVVLLSGKMLTEFSAMLELNMPLTHELFHLWLPNALGLDGQYDWFYEGFTLYQALRAGVRLNYFLLPEYFSVLSRAYDAYQDEKSRDTKSLLEISKQRWLGANALIYNKGVLTAFLYDLTLRQKSKNKLSLDDFFRELFKAANSTAKKDGNSVVIETLSRYEGMKDFVTQYIENSSAIDFSTALLPFGLISRQDNGKTVIKVNKNLTSPQRALLKNLGYNEILYRGILN